MGVMTEYADGQFSWVDLAAHDYDAAKQFYGALFGWNAVDQDTGGHGKYAMFLLDGESVAGLGECPPDMKAAGMPAMWNNYITVDNLEETLGKVEGLGGKVTMPAMKVMEAGWMAGIQDPSEGYVLFWQKNEHCGATHVNDPGCFCWNELVTKSAEPAMKFYEALFGWTYKESKNAMGGRYIEISNQGRMNGGMIEMDHHPAWCVYFNVADYDATAAKLQELGGKVLNGPIELPIGKFGVMLDNQGAFFNIIQMSVQPD